jgi:endonuclease/exonuclease/phosphatase (EEP) superfamily protein YafD
MLARFHDQWRRGLLPALGIVALMPALAVGLAGISGHGHRWIDLLAQFTAPAALFALAVATGLAVLRGFRMAVAALAVAALAGTSALEQARPADRPVPAVGAPTVRLYSANLWVGNADVAAIRDSLRAARPDLVILIEAADAPVAALEELLPDHPHRVMSPRARWRDGGTRTVIASRWPLGRLQELSGLHAASVRAETPLGSVRLTAAHLTRPWPYQVQWEQIRQSGALARQVRAGDGPQIVAGDFNSVSTARIGDGFRADSGLIPAPAFPGTWPAQLPAPLGISIDHVWISPDLAVVERRLGRPTGSDHRPVVTVLTRAQP